MWKVALVFGNFIGLFFSFYFSIFLFCIISASYYFATRRYALIFVMASLILWTKMCWVLQVNQQWTAEELRRPLAVVGIVTQVLQHDATHARFYFQTTEVNGKPLQRRLLLGWYRDAQPITAGQRWQFHAKLKNPHRYANPGSFDYDGYLFSQGIVATGYVQGKTATLLDQSWRYAPLAVWREAIIRYVQNTLRTDTNWLLVLIFGERQNLDPRWQSVMQNTGTNHLLSISGLHIGLIASLIYFVLRLAWSLSPRLCGRIAAPQAAVVGSMFMAIVYAWLAGFSLSTQRSLLMLAVILWSTLTRQASQLFSRLSLAFALLLVIEPFSLLQSGFVLSFYAVLLLWYGLQNRLANRRDWNSWLRPQMVMTIGLIPISVYYFQQISVLSLLANMVAIPWVELLVLPLLLFTAFMTWVPAIATLTLKLSNILLNALFVGLEWMVQVFPAFWSSSFSSVYEWLFVTIGGLLLVAPRGFPSRYISVVFCLPLLIHRDSTVPNGEFWLTQLDVGQGNATLVRTAHHTLVFDVGPPGTSSLLPYLQQVHRSRIDRVIISHSDADHRGGLPVLQARVPIDSIVTSEAKWVTNWKASLCQRGQKWVWDGVEFEFLHPPRDRTFATTNDGSCVLRIRRGDHQAILTGDIQALAEAYLVEEYGKGLQSDILLAPHHGSRTSSGREFIAAVQPKWVIMSTGYENRFHFPHPSVVQRYRMAQAKIINTATCGAATFQVRDSGIKTSCYRDKLMEFYRY